MLHSAPFSSLTSLSVSPISISLCNQFWQVEVTGSGAAGRPITWSDGIYLRHLNTGRYLHVSDAGICTLQGEADKSKCVLSMHRAAKNEEGDKVRSNSVLRLEMKIGGECASGVLVALSSVCVLDDIGWM